MDDAHEKLTALRARIDHLDAAVIYLLAERFALTGEVGHLKSTAKMPPSDEARETYQIARLRRLAEEVGIDPRFAEEFIRLVITYVIRNHKAIAEVPQPGA